MAKPIEKTKARAMRAAGVSMKEIARALAVSPSSVHLWTHDVALPAELEGPIPGRLAVSPEASAARIRAWSEMNRAKRSEYQQEGRRAARRGSPLHQAGCMLYWAEGAKGRNSVRLTNSDAELVRFFVRFLREAFRVTSERMRLTLNVYTTNGLDLAEIEAHWLETLELPRSSLRKHQLNHFPTSSSGRRGNKLPYGVASITVGSTQIIQHIYGAIQEYGGFDEPRWLDCDRRATTLPAGG